MGALLGFHGSRKPLCAAVTQAIGQVDGQVGKLRGKLGIGRLRIDERGLTHQNTAPLPADETQTRQTRPSEGGLLGQHAPDGGLTPRIFDAAGRTGQMRRRGMSAGEKRQQGQDPAERRDLCMHANAPRPRHGPSHRDYVGGSGTGRRTVGGM